MKDTNEKLMMLSEAELRDLLLDVALDICRRLQLQSSRESPSHEWDSAPLVDSPEDPSLPFLQGYAFGTLSETRKKSRQRIGQLEDIVFSNMVSELFQEILRRFPDLEVSLQKSVALKVDDSFTCLESMISQLYSNQVKSDGGPSENGHSQTTQALFQVTEALSSLQSRETSDSLLSLADANEKCLTLEKDLLDQRIKVQDLQVEYENVSFSRNTFAGKCSTLENLLKTLQAKFDELHQNQLELVEAKRDNDALVESLGTKVKLTSMFVLHSVDICLDSQP